MEVLSSISEDTEIRYRKEELAAAPFARPPLDQIVQQAVHEIPAVVRQPLHRLEEHSKGLSSVEISGFPEKWELRVDCKGVRVAPILHKALVALDAAERAEEENAGLVNLQQDI